MTEDSTERAKGVVARILARTGTALESTQGQDHHAQAGELEREHVQEPAVSKASRTTLKKFLKSSTARSVLKRSYL